MSMLRANYSDLYSSAALPVLEEIFASELARYPNRRDQLFKVVSTDRDIWQSTEMHDLSLFNEMQEGQDYSYEQQAQGASQTLTVAKWGLGVKFTEELIEDGKFSFIADALKKLPKSGMETKELEGMKIFNQGFDTKTSADGQFVFDVDHSLPSGLTFRNELSTAADLSPDSLRDAITDFETQFVGDSGIIASIRPKVLLVPSALRAYAQELVMSQLKPDSSDNNMNSLASEGLMVVSSPHLTDTDAWFLLAEPSETGLRVVNRKPMETKATGPDNGFDDDTLKYKARYREVVGVTHPYGIFGSPGA